MAGAIAYKGKIYFEGGGLSPESLASYEATSTASKAYAIGDLIVLGDLLYEVTAPIASGDTIVAEGASANVVQTSVEEQLDNIGSDVSGKADKVASATNGNLAGLDANGNLTDSNITATDVVTKSSTSGLIKNDGTIDTNTYEPQVTTMPTASADYVGKVYHYIGATGGGYTHGFYYECKEDSGNYSWEILNVAAIYYTEKPNEAGGVTVIISTEPPTP